MFKNLTTFIVILFLAMSSNKVFASSEVVESPKKSADQQENSLTITNVWARASIPSNPNSAAYLEITNNDSQREYIILSASTLIANNVELHNSFVDEKGISRMTTIDRVVVPAGSTIEFKPGGMHVMLLDLKKPLRQGDTFDLTLNIEDGSPIKIECEVRN